MSPSKRKAKGPAETVLRSPLTGGVITLTDADEVQAYRRQGWIADKENEIEQAQALAELHPEEPEITPSAPQVVPVVHTPEGEGN